MPQRFDIGARGLHGIERFEQAAQHFVFAAEQRESIPKFTCGLLLRLQLAQRSAALAEIATALDQMDSVVENKFARAATMLINGADEFRSSLGKARGSIARAQSTSGDDADPGERLAVVR